MKTLQARLFAGIATLLLLAACQKTEPEHTAFWSEASYATINAITGTYSLVSATWSAPIDLSGKGLVSEDVLFQMQTYGWTGVQSLTDQGETTPTSVLQRSEVLKPDSPAGLTQVNLYVPYPEWFKGNPRKPIVPSDGCGIGVRVYQFHYQVDSRGNITLLNISDRAMSGEGGWLQHVKIRFEGACIYFDADTSLYDWSGSEWQDGHLALRFKHN